MSKPVGSMDELDEILEKLSYESCCEGFTVGDHSDLGYVPHLTKEAKAKLQALLDATDKRAISEAIDVVLQGDTVTSNGKTYVIIDATDPEVYEKALQFREQLNKKGEL